MSILSSVFQDLLSLVAPSCCAVCKGDLAPYENYICFDCQADMPLTGFHNDENNTMAERLRSLSPAVHHASSYLYLRMGTKWHRFFHKMKYFNGWRDCQKIGRWYGVSLAQSPHYKDVDVILPVPLHPFRRIRRGYNQSEYIALGIAKSMGVSIRTSMLRRRRNNSSQTRKGHQDRWSNVDGIFTMRKGSLSGSCHIMLVDDIFTTGATIITCIDAILEVLPEARISVVTIAASAKQLKMNN